MLQVYTGGLMLGASVTVGQSEISNGTRQTHGSLSQTTSSLFSLCSPLWCDPLGSKMQLFCYTNYEQILQLPRTVLNVLKAQGCADKGFENSLPDNSSSQHGYLPRSLTCPHSTVNIGSTAVALTPPLVISTAQWPAIGTQCLFFHFLFIIPSTSSSNSLSCSSSTQLAHLIVPMDQFLLSCVCL